MEAISTEVIIPTSSIIAPDQFTLVSTATIRTITTTSITTITPTTTITTSTTTITLTTTITTITPTTTITTSTTTITPTTAITTSTTPNIICPRWLQFGLIINVTTNASHPEFTFCFHVNQSSSDVTVAANTWVPCANWKVSGAADPLMDLYVIGNNLKMLAQNDDGNSIPHLNCYASVLSYRLDHGNYRV
ncbi:unnamed protein product, partial [Rotaria sordida]